MPRPLIAIALVACSGDNVAPAPPYRAEVPTAQVGDKVSVRGAVFDRDKGTPVGGVTVVFLGKAGEATAVTSADGSYALTVPRGRYRPFVRDTDMITVGLQERVRLDNGPNGALPNLLDESLLPTLDVDRDLSAIDLTAAKVAQDFNAIESRNL